MEGRKKDEEPGTNELLNKDEHDEQNVAHTGKKPKTGSSSNDNTISENNQCLQVTQWPYTPQNAVDQSPLTSKPPIIPAQSASPIVISQWNFPHQQNPDNNLVQQGQLPLNHSQPTPPFWLLQRPGHPLPAMNSAITFQPLIPVGASEVTWQAPALGGGTSSTVQPPVPNFVYPLGYSFPGLPGPCDPSSWWGQAQQSQSLCTYAFPRLYNHVSPAPSSSPGQLFQRGVIRPPAKLSQKHQQLWDAQSAENVQLWNVFNHLQSEVTDFKNRLLKLEAEVASFKPKVEEPTVASQVPGTFLGAQPSKRGRPKKTVAANDVVASPEESHPRARGRKPATSKFKIQSDAKVHLFEKVVLSKLEDKEKERHATATMEQGNGENTLISTAYGSGSFEINGSNMMTPAFHHHACIPICGNGFAPPLEIKKTDDKSTGLKTSNSNLSHQGTGMSAKSSSVGYTNVMGNGNLEWPANITSEQAGRNMLSIGSQGFYHNGSVIRQGGELVSGWSFVNEDDTSEELQDAVLGSTHDENDKIREDPNSCADHIARSKDDGAVGSSPKELPPLNNW